jgi:hypothetical protein
MNEPRTLAQAAASFEIMCKLITGDRLRCGFYMGNPDGFEERAWGPALRYLRPTAWPKWEVDPNGNPNRWGYMPVAMAALKRRGIEDPRGLVTRMRVYYVIRWAATSGWRKYEWAKEMHEELRPHWEPLQHTLLISKFRDAVARWFIDDRCHWESWMVYDGQEIFLADE